MGLFGSNKKEGELQAERKFDYINLADFHSHSFWTGFAYFFIYIGILISLCAYAADIYTAANLLIFNKWSSKLQPAVEFSISKWIFAGCIILSFVLLAFEWGIAIKTLRGNGVAEIYLNSVAQRWACIFGGRGRREDTGWKRFLVFARLTKSKRGVDYVALFTYFSFKGWIRTIFAEGPRQAINALTLYSVMEADIIPHNVKKGEELSAIFKFFENFAALGRQDRAQALVLGAMLFTLIIWVFAMLQLFIAGMLYIIYLCHVIGSDSGLYGYCKVRVDEKLGEIVATNHRKELARQQKADTSKSGGVKGPGSSNPTISRQPTVPLGLNKETGVLEKTNIAVASYPKDANGNRIPKLPDLAGLEKPAPVATSIATQSRMGSTRSTQSRPHVPTRSATTATSDSRTYLLNDQANMGYGGRGVERHPSSAAGSIYTQRSGYDSYGNPESPLSMMSPSVPNVRRPMPTPSRQQMRPPPPSMQQGLGPSAGPMRDEQVVYEQSRSQQQYGRQPIQRGEYNGDYDSRDNYDISGYYDRENSYIHDANQHQNYQYNGYEGNSMYPNTHVYNQPIIPEDQEYHPPSRPQTQNSQRQFNGGYSTSTTPTPIMPSQSAYPPPPMPPLSRAFTTTSNPQASNATSTGLSHNQASCSDNDDKQSLHSQGRQFLNDFDFELEKKSDIGNGSSSGNSGMEIEMTSQTATLSVITDRAVMDSDEETRSQGNLAETSTFGGAKSSRASQESLRSTSSSSSNDSVAQKLTPKPQTPRQQTETSHQYTAYNSPINATPIRNLTSNSSTSSPISPPRRAATMRNIDTEPIDYFNSTTTPRRIGTAPPSSSTQPTSYLPQQPPIDYFGTERTPARVGTAPPLRTRAEQRRNLTSNTSSPLRDQHWDIPRLRRAETAPMEIESRNRERGRGSGSRERDGNRDRDRYHNPRGYGDDGGDMV